MFDHAINSLLAGSVICRYTDREGYEYLSQENSMEDANRFLGRIGKRVVSPSGGGAFFLVPTDLGAVKKAEITALHKKVLSEVRPVLGFMDLCMSAMRTDSTLRPGDQINVSVIMAAIDTENKLRSDLQDLISILARAGGATDRERLESVITRLESWGYIKSENAEREIYCATGMIDVFHDTVAFFIEHTPGAREYIDAQENQGDLF